MDNSSKPLKSNNDDMDIDPIDDGPRPTPAPTPVLMANATTPAALLTPVVLTQEEQAREAIEALLAEDMAARVTAAHRLPAIAAVLGPERTRAVSRNIRARECECVAPVLHEF